MKWRIRGNALRLRLTRSEVARFGEVGRVEDAIEFGPEPQQRLVCMLQASADAPAVAAQYDGHCITVTVPASVARQWVESEQVGMEGEQPLGAGRALRLLIEKDFACIHKREEDRDPDAFPRQRPRLDERATR